MFDGRSFEAGHNVGTASLDGSGVSSCRRQLASKNRQATPCLQEQPERRFLAGCSNEAHEKSEARQSFAFQRTHTRAFGPAEAQRMTQTPFEVTASNRRDPPFWTINHRDAAQPHYLSLRCRIRARMRRFALPILRRPRPVLLTPIVQHSDGSTKTTDIRNETTS